MHGRVFSSILGLCSLDATSMASNFKKQVCLQILSNCPLAGKWPWLKTINVDILTLLSYRGLDRSNEIVSVWKKINCSLLLLSLFIESLLCSYLLMCYLMNPHPVREAMLSANVICKCFISKKFKQRVKQLALGHTASKWQMHDSNTGVTLKLTLLITVLFFL